MVTGAGLRPKAKAMEQQPDPTEPARQFSTLLMSGDWKRGHGSRTETRSESTGQATGP